MGIISRLIKTFLSSSKKSPSLNKPSAQSKAKIDLIIKQAQETTCAINDSLNNASQSKELSTRENELKNARDKLVKLKNLATKYPFIKLERLEAVEASIIAVEAETHSLAYNEITDPSIKDVPDKAQPESLELREDSRFDEQRLSASDEQAIHIIQSCFRVVNESIEIARKSKNHETKVSRLGVARNSLKEAQKQARQFSLEIEGFDKAEAEINRIDEAIRAGTPTEIAGMQEIDLNTEFFSPARTLLKEATALKKEKKYIEACVKLREAYSADGAENLMIEDRLRLPMYLQLAGKNDEGWDELNRLSSRYTDQFSQPRISHQMKIFLRKENNETASNPVRVILRGDNNKPLEAESGSNSVTVGEFQNAPMPSWMADECEGFEFCATLQLRTPLRVLLRHGELYIKHDGRQPQIVREPWEGIWNLKTKTWKELGIDFEEMPHSHASDVGPILVDDYLPFLIAVRKILELNDSIENRIKILREYPMVGDWRTYVEKLDGIENIIQRFFPRFIDTIPLINEVTIAELTRLGLDTPNRIATAPDETLLNIKGIGQAKLKTIREYCAGISNNRDNKRLENVTR
jgi:hypothetical protein